MQMKNDALVDNHYFHLRQSAFIGGQKKD